MNPDQQNNYWQPDQNDEVDQTSTPQQPEQSAQQSSPDAPVTWSASEYIHGEKNALWYVLFAVVIVGLIALDVFVLKSWTFSILVIVMAFAVVIYARRPPRTIQYTLSAKQGLYIGERLYNLAEYKAFGLIRDGEHHSIMLIPVKRFAAGVSVYFPEEAGEQIVDILGARLPMQTLKLDIIDVVVRRLRL
jgi:ABC-type multidrug transport system fused ATPase/permease subunit